MWRANAGDYSVSAHCACPTMTPLQTLAAVRPPARSIESVLASRWARLLVPSLSDLFFLAILVWLFMSSGSAGWQGLLVDGDAGWHIRTGEYILDHQAVPRHHLYSFSQTGGSRSAV